MNRICVTRSLRGVFLLPLVLSAQTARVERNDVAPLKNWSTPLYWQPSQAERQGFSKLISAPTSSFGTETLVFVAMTPCRVIDTRSIFGFPAPFGAPSLVGGATRSFPMQTSTLCGIPSTAAAYSLNVTVTPTGGVNLGFLTVWPVGSTQPNASTINNPNGLFALANAVIVPAGNDSAGSLDVYASNATDLIVDINGYFASVTNPTTFNTAIGVGALQNNTTGLGNVATGLDSLFSTTTGGFNTGDGYQTLYNNTSGTQNTASGWSALYGNTTGSQNTAYGKSAMFQNTTGNLNTAVGSFALTSNSTGSNNTALGADALTGAISASHNTAIGYNALFSDSSGATNTAVGEGALGNNIFASNNIAVGYNAAGSVGTGAMGGSANSNNIHIGNVGATSDTNTIKIGTSGTQTSFFAAGISGVTTGLSGAVNVVVDANGQLGTISSSARFKEDIHDMDEASSRLFQLRPVTFRYKQPYADGSKPLDYGLIAEEVAKVYPDLVVTDAKGQIQTVQYQKLTPMLLNEVQKQHEQMDQQSATIQALQAQVDELKALLSKLAEK